MNYKDSPHLVKVFDFDVLHMELNTFLYMLVLVVVVLFFLHRLLFKPVLRTLEARAQLKESLLAEARGHREEIERLGAEYESRLATVREEVAQVRAEAMREAQAEVSAILEQARAEAQAAFQAAMTELQNEVQQARTALGEASRRLAEQTTNRILQA